MERIEITYKINDPMGWMGDPTRGAALGRTTIQSELNGQTLFVTRTLLDEGGYDDNGTYFGIGKPLFWVHSKDGCFDYTIRATNLYLARQCVLVRYPKARIGGDKYHISLDLNNVNYLLSDECHCLGTKCKRANNYIMKLASKYESAVIQNLEKWIFSNLNAIDIEKNNIEADDNGFFLPAIVRILSGLGNGAAYYYYIEAEGGGIGTWDGIWDHMFKDTSKIRELSNIIKQSTQSQYQALKDAMIECAEK